MIGNDIVDLRYAAIQSDWKRKGWLQKIFTESERYIISESLQPALKIWELWSMKEAAYKAHQRRFSLSPKYNPWEYVCTESRVSIDTYQYDIVSQCTNNYIHTIAMSYAIEYVSRICMNTNRISYKDILREDISVLKKISTSTITIAKNENRIPYVKIRNQVVDLLVSTSNHGEFSAFIIKKT